MPWRYVDTVYTFVNLLFDKSLFLGEEPFDVSIDLMVDFHVTMTALYTVEFLSKCQINRSIALFKVVVPMIQNLCIFVTYWLVFA